MVSSQDTYEAGPNGNEVLGPNPGTNILTTNHIYAYDMSIYELYYLELKYLNIYIHIYTYIQNNHMGCKNTCT